MQATLHHIEELTANIKTFWFEPERTFRFTAGQFTELYLPHDHPDDRGTKRWFTISSSPTEALFSITTKFAAENGSTFKHALSELKPGDTIEAAEAMGDFVLPKQTTTPLIFVAGGIGLTPFHSMFEWLIATGEERNIRFLYAVKSEDDIIFQDVFAKANVHATIVVSEASEAWGGLRGRLEASTIVGVEQPNDDTLIYVSGPEGMVQGLKKDLLVAGLKKSQVVTDDFPGYTSL